MQALEKWRGRSALITGASSGIGVAFARNLAKAGCNLILTARRTERLEELKAEIQAKFSVQVDVITADLAEPSGPREMMMRVGSLERKVDLLINNAGVGLSGPFDKTYWKSEARMIQLNVTSVVELTKLVIPGMIERRQGDILLVGSMVASLPMPEFAVYAGTKGFINAFGEAAGQDLRPYGINLTVLNPGMTATEFMDTAGYHGGRLSTLGMMKADVVAQIGLKALSQRKVSILAGFLNKLTVLASYLLPRRWRLWITQKAVQFAAKSTS